MKKVFILLSVGAFVYANAALSCEEMTQKKFDTILLDYKNSIKLNHFKNPSKEFTEEDKQYISKVSHSSRAIKRCQYILDLNTYSVEDGRRYKAFYKLKDFKLTQGEKRLFTFRLNESIKKYRPYSSVSVVSNRMSKYPLVHLAVSQDENLVSIHEFRLKNHKVEKKRVDTDGIVLPFYSGTIKNQNAYIAYLNKVYQTQFKSSSAIQLDRIGADVHKNIKKSRSVMSSTRILKADIRGVTTYQKYDEKLYKTDILKGSTIKYLHQRAKSTDYVIEYDNKKWTISEKQWYIGIGGR